LKDGRRRRHAKWLGRSALLIVLTASVSVSAKSTSNPQATLDQGRVAYERGDYRLAIDTIHPLLYPSIALGSEDAVVEAHRLLALSYFFEKKEPEAEQEVASLLTLRPNYEPDPIVDPPLAVRFFEGVRHRQDERLRDVRQRQAEEDARSRKEAERKKAETHAKAERVYVERTVETHSRFIAMIPFGVGQIQNHQLKKGIFFATSEIVFGTLSAAMLLTIFERYPGGHFPYGSDTVTPQALIGTQLAAGAVFWGLVAWGIIDAQVKLVPRQVVNTHEIQPPTAKTKKQSFLFSPLVSPGFYGLGAHGVF
jgi:hypothetical protein